MSTRNEYSDDPRELENRADAKRSSINETLSQLEQHFSPNQMLDQAMGMFRGNGDEMARNLGRTVRDNPVPVLLTGIGLAWMAMSQNNGRREPPARYGHDSYPYTYPPEYGYSPDRAGTMSSHIDRRDRGYYTAEDAPAHPTRPGHLYNTASSPVAENDDDKDGGAMDAVKQAGEQARDSMDTLGEKAREAGEQARQRVDELGDSASRRYHEHMERARFAADDWRYRGDRQMQRMRGELRSSGEEISRFMQEQPLVVGAAGIAIGALIGSLLPATRTEDRLMGEYSDPVTEEAAHKAGDALKQGASLARARVENTANAVADKAREKIGEKAADEKEINDKTAQEAETSSV